ncbi:MAG TPA: GNAT family N-acetyltransferase [Rhizomicrobium sp.]|nr:GNAT family N-acetyltransferase [Rhizomicrobium sp.]
MLDIALVTAPDDDLRQLVGELNDELGALYSAEQRHGLTLDALFQPHIRFFVARADGRPAGCGGVALFDGFAEIKRMYVRVPLRGQGVADAIMARLIAETVEAGLTLLKLETGVYSGAAIQFYRRNGFAVCAAYEPYTAMPSQAIITSVFMEKSISVAPAHEAVVRR